MARDTRPSASRRGYGTDWQRLRKTIPPRDCPCGATWHSRFNLDHIKARAQGGTDAPSNLRWLCPSCHSSKTTHADGGWGRAKCDPGHWRPKRTAIGVDGWPKVDVTQAK